MQSFQKSRAYCPWLAVVLLLCLAIAPALAIHPDGELLSLEVALGLALAANPGLAEVKARAEAMAAIPSQAGSPPDPTVSFNAMYLPTNSFSLHQEDMTMLEIGVHQTVPFPGKLAAAERASEYEAAAAAQTVAEARLRLARDVKLHWWELYYLERTLALLADTEGLLRQLVATALARYRSGGGTPPASGGTQQEVLEAQLALSKLGEERLIHTGMHHREAARLNALLDRPGTTMVHLPPTDTQALPEVGTTVALTQAATTARPLLQGKQHAINAAESRVALAEKGYYPDVSLDAGYAFRERDPNNLPRSDFLRLGVSLSLPIHAGAKQAKAVDQRRSELMKERYALADAQRQVQADIAQEIADYQRAKAHHALLTREVIPLAQQVVATLQANHAVGKAALTEVLRALAGLRGSETQAWRAYTEAHQALARLTAAQAKEEIP